jgi:CheY-like chemotaxis protein
MAVVLIVDDNADACRVMARLVLKCGHEAHYVTSGEGALSVLAARHVDLMILDSMMGGIDGMEVLRRVRSDPRQARLKVVMWSAVTDPHFVEQARLKGAADYWVKAGFSYGELGRMLGRVLAEPGGDPAPSPA